jgi:DNA-binding winged helix-turn-helix (wHTH) protein
LRRGTKLVAVEPQVFDILQYLIAQRDRVVSKEDLIDTVWGGRIVSESALTSRLTAVRHAIGDSGEAQRLIRTIPRKGFRFVGEVGETTDTSSARAPQAVTDVAKSVALADGDPCRVIEKTDREVVTEERKHVTVLWADLKDSLGLIAERDPEQALRTFNAVIELMTPRSIATRER